MRLLLATTLPKWRTFEPLHAQFHRNETAAWLRLVADQIANNGAREGAGWRLELEPAVKPEAA
jgi:hypothetical protein